MDGRDLNLLRALDALLDEGSVAGAARRLGLSASAMSRTLSRLREATGDPLLVRAGRGMVLTPHAEMLKERVPHLAAEAEAVLRPAETVLDPASLQRDFVIRANDGFVAATVRRCWNWCARGRRACASFSRKRTQTPPARCATGFAILSWASCATPRRN